MRRPICATYVILALLLSTGASAQLVPVVPVPLPAVPVSPAPTVSAVTDTVVTTVKSVAKAVPGVRKVTTTVGSAVEAPQGIAGATQPLRSTTRASSLLDAPLTRAGTGPPATAAAAPTAAPARPPLARDPAPSIGLDRVASLPASPTPAGEAALAGARTVRLQTLIRQNPQDLDSDDLGQPIVRGQLVLLDVDEASLTRLERSGFKLLADEQHPQLALRLTTLQVPAGFSARSALVRLRAIAPRIEADYNHIFEPAGGSLGAARAGPAKGGGTSGPLVGMIDGGVAAHPSLAGRIVEQKGFTGALKATRHGTAIASLLVGKQGRFRGSAPGARLLVADVYGGRASAGSATAIARAMSWLAARRPAVINISLVGPRNELVRRAVAGLRTRGIEIVAAVGNDGPAAPPQYPASYPGVIAITGVDARGVVLFEAGNAAGLDFAAPGADMAAARPGNGYARVRGTSFAAPLAAGRLAQLRSPKQLAAEARPGKGRVGQGIVCAACRIAPQLVGAK